MSEAMTIPPLADASAKRTPTVYFIDDSATMREVIKIAFRRESINIITCGDAAAALAQFAQNPPDAVITDVIMPDQDGYSVCTQIKQHPEYGSVPVILMSGVVNKTVADKAVAAPGIDWPRKEPSGTQNRPVARHRTPNRRQFAADFVRSASTAAATDCCSTGAARYAARATTCNAPAPINDGAARKYLAAR